MNERDLADQFNKDVERLLTDSGRADSASPPADYGPTLDLARKLIAVDFSAESQVRHSLRRKLLAQVGKAQGRKETRVNTYPYPNPLRQRLLTAVGGALALLLLMMLLYPGGPAVAAQSIENGAKLIILGAYSTAQRIEAQVTGKPMPENEWHIELYPGFGVGGNGLPGTNPTVTTATTFDEAQQTAAFDIRQPAYLPEGYILQEIKLAPIWTGPGALLFPNTPNAYLFYENANSVIVIAQSPVGSQSLGDNASIGQFVGFATNGWMKEVEFDGHKAAWAEGNILVWEKDEISYLLGGPNLALEEAIRIAESLD
jgi:hypothetical protein